jgi:hypothetical protein
MTNADETLRNLSNGRRETLDLELKQWIDPTSDEGIAKIVKACLALRNNNGGSLVIGFKDDGNQDLENAPTNVQETFHSDKVQEIVSRFAADPFPIDVQFGMVGKQYHPVVTVPAGVRSPVAAKSTLKSADGRSTLIKDNAIYVRSLNSNHTVSSAEARRGDWDRLIRICFDNREADIGAFVRRHLAGMNMQSLAALFQSIPAVPHRPTFEERVVEELARGHTRFLAAAKQRALAVPAVGFRESAIVLDEPLPAASATNLFLRKLFMNAPHHSGWSPWVDLSGATDTDVRPYVFDGGWEALVDYLDPRKGLGWVSLDFWRIEPSGHFYQIRALEDDFVRGREVQPGTQLDFTLQIARVAEIISIGLAFSRALLGEGAKSSVLFGFRWTGLSGRTLSTWANRSRLMRQTEISNQDEITTRVSVAVETPLTALAPHVEIAVRDLFALFGGTELASSVIEEIVTSAIGGR